MRHLSVFLIPSSLPSKLILELHQLPEKVNRSWDEGYAIKMIYFNETFSPIDSKPYVLRTPVCSEQDLCTVKQFFGFISDYTLGIGPQWNKLCYRLGSSANSQTSSATTLAYNPSVYLLGFLLVLLSTVRSSSTNRQ